MINESNFISDILLKTGLAMMAWPFENQTPEQFVRQVILTSTLPEWSQFSPITRQFSVNTGKLKLVSKSGLPIEQRNQLNSGQFFLPDEILKYPDLMSIRNVQPDFSGYDQDNNIIYNFNAGNAYNLGSQVIDSVAFSGFVGQMGIQRPFEYIPPNRIFLKGFYGPICITAGYSHQTLQTVNPNSRTYLTQLAVLDVKSTGYQMLKHYNGISSAFGNINLRIEEWATADNDREVLLNSWRDRYGDGQVDFFQYL